jgi:hypothetical protein
MYVYVNFLGGQSYRAHYIITKAYFMLLQELYVVCVCVYVYIEYLYSTAFDKTKYMVMSRDRNAGRDDSVKIDNSSIDSVEEFKYLGMMLTDQNSVQEEIRSRLKLGNACYHSVQNLLSSKLLSKSLKIKIYRTIILPVVLYACVKPGR